jgi:hypothetical protein
MDDMSQADIDVSDTVADDRRDDRRNIDWVNVPDERRGQIRRRSDRMAATPDEVNRLCSTDAGKLHRPATPQEILRIARQRAQG